jgi:hypothetical protein
MSANATSEHFLAHIDRLIDWAALAPLIGAFGSGARPGAPLIVVKMLLLARWYGMGEVALLEACQDRISFRRFLGLPLGQSTEDAGLAEAYRRHALQSTIETQNLLHAIETQLETRGLAIRPGAGADAAIVASPSDAAASGIGVNETSFFQAGEIADLLRKGERSLVRGGARASTTPSYATDPAVLTPPPRREIAPLRTVIEWPWGFATEIEGHLTIGREPGYCAFAPELAAYLHVSRKHAELTACPEGVWIRDLRSRNGTFVNDEQIPPGQAYLVDTDARLRFGPYCIVQLKIR